MEILQQIQGAVTVIKPVGALTLDDVDRFKSIALDVLNKSLGRFVVDASSVPFIDSRGLEAIADISDQLEQSGRALKLCCPQPTVSEILSLTGWASAMEFYDDLNAGIRSFL